MDPTSTTSALSRFSTAETASVRNRLLTAYPSLASPMTVEALCDQASNALRADLESAGLAADSALWLARHLDHPLSIALSLRTFGNVQVLRGDTADGLKSYLEALALFRQHGPKDQVARTLQNLISAHLRDGSYDAAYRDAIEAEELFNQVGDPIGIARVKINLGSLLFRQDNFQAARSHWRQALATFKKADLAQDTAIALRNLAVCEISLNNHHSALSIYYEVSSLCLTANLPQLAHEIEYNIAYLYFLKGDYDRALRGYSLARERSHDLGDTYHAALCDLDEAELYLELSLLEESERLAASAVKLFQQLGKRYEQSKALVFRGLAVSRLGDNHLAQEYLSASYSGFEAEKNLPWLSLVLLYQAIAFLREGRQAEARRAALHSERSFTQLGNPAKTALCRILLARMDLDEGSIGTALDQAQKVRELLKKQDYPEILFHTYCLLGDIADANDDTEAARQHYYAAQALLEQFRTHFFSSSLQIPSSSDRITLFERLLTLESARLQEPALSRQAFSLIERAKVRTLVDLMGPRATVLQSSIQARSALVQRVRGLREELQWYYRKIARHELDALPTKQPTSASPASLHELEEELLKGLRLISREDPAFGSVMGATEPDLGAVQETIGDDEVVLEYFAGREVIYALVLSRTRSDFRAVAIAADVDELRRLLEFQFSKRLQTVSVDASKRRRSVELTQQYLERLYLELLGPVADLLSDYQRLVIIPDRSLAYLPFHAFTVEKSPLAQRYLISYQASMAALRLSRKLRPITHERTALILGGRERADEAGLPSRKDWRRRFISASAADDSWIDEMAQGWGVVHLPLETELRRSNPFLSRIAIAGQQQTLLDIFRLRIGADVVVATGCGFSGSQGGNGEELLGLSRGLLYAGPATAVLPLWPSDQGTRARSLETFYAELARERSPAEAMASAYRGLAQDYPHPADWAVWAAYGP